jgi:DNA modification methylase
VREPPTSTGGASFGKQRHSTAGSGAQSRRLSSPVERCHPLGKNKRSVWTIPFRSFPGQHFAVFPRKLIEPAILAGAPNGGTVLDPFAGSGTVGHVAEELDRNAVLVELNPLYIAMQKSREAMQDLLEPDGTETSPDDEKPGWLF